MKKALTIGKIYTYGTGRVMRKVLEIINDGAIAVCEVWTVGDKRKQKLNVPTFANVFEREVGGRATAEAAPVRVVEKVEFSAFTLVATPTVEEPAEVKEEPRVIALPMIAESSIQAVEEPAEVEKEEVPTYEVKKKFEPGAVLVDSWGWEQTNIDFYLIVSRTKTMATLQRLKSIRNESEFLSGTCMPGAIDENEAPIKRKIKSFGGKENNINPHEFSYGQLWNGEPQRYSSYA